MQNSTLKTVDDQSARPSKSDSMLILDMFVSIALHRLNFRL